MQKYKEYVDRMLLTHKTQFDEFKHIHDRYVLEQGKFQDEFNESGEKIREILNEWENKLCKQSEVGGYSHYTPKLAEKFREEVRKHFSMIDFIGVKVSYNPSSTKADDFLLKKISLH